MYKPVRKNPEDFLIDLAVLHSIHLRKAKEMFLRATDEAFAVGVASRVWFGIAHDHLRYAAAVEAGIRAIGDAKYADELAGERLDITPGETEDEARDYQDGREAAREAAEHLQESADFQRECGEGR